MKNPQRIRESLGLPRIVVAVRAGVSEPSVKLYETDPFSGVTPRIRQKLDPVYAQLASELEARA